MLRDETLELRTLVGDIDESKRKAKKARDVEMRALHAQGLHPQSRHNREKNAPGAARGHQDHPTNVELNLAHGFPIPNAPGARGETGMEKHYRGVREREGWKT